MKVHLSNGSASVHTNTGVESPCIGMLTPETIFDIGESVEANGAEWVDVLLPSGIHGVVPSSLEITNVRAFRIAVSEAKVCREPAFDSASGDKLEYGERVLADKPINGKGGQWTAIYSSNGAKRGFVHVDTFVDAEEVWEFVVFLRSAAPCETTCEVVLTRLRDLRWQIEPKTEATILATHGGAVRSKTTLLNLGIGLLRFAIWPLIYSANPRANILGGSLFQKPSVSIVVVEKPDSSVVCLKFPSSGLYGHAHLHDFCKTLILDLKSALCTDNATTRQTGKSFSPQRVSDGMDVSTRGSAMNQQMLRADYAPSDIKFECSTCGQHIVCDTAAAGQEVECPACQTKITIPDQLGS